ncbi:hypothetical protein PVAP13_7KG054072 [Panicum virgatum]|uniref:Uncharacterized protein n=1 Tax=Panicum virgatum TaxID=38727 RepID=A0A8T0QIJ5_PANVG|nr:hypothetical protein PVAP13_7KG054072 [Panicum virgatum]
MVQQADTTGSEHDMHVPITYVVLTHDCLSMWMKWNKEQAVRRDWKFEGKCWNFFVIFFWCVAFDPR